MSVLVKLLHRDATIPQRAGADDAGYDLTSVGEVTILPGGHALVPTGIAIVLEPGTVGLIHPRSGLAFKHGVTVLNAPGTIDSGYRGEVGVLLINHGVLPFEVSVGDRIAQMVFQEYLAPELLIVDDVGESERGDGGFGSTGVRKLHATEPHVVAS